MPNAADIDATAPISILLKSPFGFGKTIAACSMAVDGPVWLAYWDKKSPIELLNYFKKIGRADILKNIEYDVYGSTNAHEYLNKLMKLQKDCRLFGHVNDSVTMMTASAVNWSMGFRNPKGPQIDSLNPSAYKLIPDFDEYKVETSLVTQALDICRSLPCNVIWTAHPIPTMKVEEAGGKMKISKVNNIVSYGSKVAGMVPGQFTEIYHMSLTSEWDGQAGKARIKRIVNTIGTGDDFAKTAFNLPDEMDITNKLFWEVLKTFRAAA